MGDLSYLFTTESLVSFLLLTIMEIVVGIDNVVFVSIILSRVAARRQALARRMWLVSGIGIRVALILGLGWMAQQKGVVVFELWGKGFDLGSIVMISGGIFLLFKTVREIHHKLEGDEGALEENVTRSITTFAHALVQIILIDLIFSFDSLIMAIGLVRHVPLMIAAIVLAMLIMYAFSGKLSRFIHRHPTLKMLALSFVVLVALVLLVQGWNAEQADAFRLRHYVYFAIAFAFTIELINILTRRSSKTVQLHEPVLDDDKPGSTP